MICTFLLPTRSTLKVLGSSIDEAIRRGHDVGVSKGISYKEPWQDGDFARWPQLRHSVQGVTIGLATDVAAQVGVSFWWDNMLEPPLPSQKVTGYLSEWHKRQHAANFPFDGAHIMKQPVIGWTFADHRALLKKNMGRPLHVCFAMKRVDPAQRTLVQRLRYHDAVRQACHEATDEDLHFVIKTRAKHRDPLWLRYYGPLIYEESVYPMTSQVLLRDAWAYTGFSSGAHLEARLFPAIKITENRVPLGAISKLAGVAASYRHMREDPLDQIISYDDTKAGERVMDLAESV